MTSCLALETATTGALEELLQLERGAKQVVS
jgi:hypothetical protein